MGNSVTRSAGEVPKPQKDYTTALTREIRLNPASTGLIVVDMQYATGSRTEGLGKKLAAEGKQEFAAERFDRIEQVVVPNIRRMLAFCREQGLPIIYIVIGSEHPDLLDMPPHMRKLALETNNRVGTRENEIVDELKPLPGETIVRKTTVSAFTSTGIDTMLRSMGLDTLLFTGVSTNMCVDTTARDAADRGYQCVLVEDCCGAAKMAYHDAALVTFQRLFGRVASSDEVRAELSTAPGRQPVPAR